jgi:predicted dehydrogenase/nucleoside-diphosphate-sugar epimerase
MNTESTSAPLTVALVGCGKMGLNHVRAIRACRAARLVAIADPAADQAKLQPMLPEGVRFFSSAGEMLDAVGPDVVHIVTPPGTHAEVAKLCLSRGAHVYVEKPFTLTTAEAREVLEAAERAGRSVCAGHQLLFEAPARALRQHLGIIGQVVHVESYFSFKTVRKSRDGRTLMSPVEQLLDILPHPVYTLLDALRSTNPDAQPEITSLEVRAEGEVHAIVRAGNATGMLVVTLRGRPVESYLRVVGTNGSLRADFVRGALTKLAGAGASAISLLTNPYREAKQIFVGSTKGFGRRILERKKGYPGLNELFEGFYTSIHAGAPSPLTPSSILETVRICERVGHTLRAAEVERERAAEASLVERTRALRPTDPARGLVLVTGGGGLLGRAVVRDLRDHGWAVRSIGRRVPQPSAREAGIEYVAADLGEMLGPAHLAGVTTVVHCAAETAGGKDAHERNTIGATRSLLRAAAAARVPNFVHVSSIAVLKPSKTVGGPLDERTPVDFGNLARGPYVWAKAEAEREVVESGPGLGLTVRVVRPGPLVDFQAYEPPGRLGRELGPVFLAVGPRSGRLSLCDVHTAAKVIRATVEDIDAAPAVINLVEPEAPTRQQLLALWLEKRPDLASIWMPAWVLSIMSPMAKLAQKILLPKSTPIDLAAAFSSEQYNAAVAADMIQRAQLSDRRLSERPEIPAFDLTAVAASNVR